MNFFIKPITKKMLAQLRRGRSIELSTIDRNICNTDDFEDTLPKLYSRGLIDIKMVMQDSEEVLCVFITKSGIDLLSKCPENGSKLGSKYNLF